MKAVSLCLAFDLVFLCPNSYSQWVQPGLGVDYSRCIAVSNRNLFVGTDGGVFLSTDSGANWNPLNNGLSYLNISAFAVRTPEIFLGLNGGYGVYRSTNDGAEWSNKGLSNNDIRCFLVRGNNLFSGADDGLFLSTDDGDSWKSIGNDIYATTHANIRALASIGSNIVAGTTDGVFISTNDGTNWTGASTGLRSTYVMALAVSGTNLIAGTNGGVFLSTDSGTNWTAASAGVPNTSVFAFAVSGTNLFAGTLDGGIFLSTDSGANWTAASTGLPNTSVFALAMSGTNLFAGTFGSGVWRRPLSEMITEVRSGALLPKSFALDQNYPNPFNPSTTIKYELPMSSMVRLSVYDMLGREVAVLVNERRNAGVYEVKFDGSGLSSGVYFCRIEVRPLDSAIGRDSKSGAGSFVQTRKPLLLK